MHTFTEFFVRATGIAGGPFAFQRAFAESENLPQLIDIPTGCGKTAMAILGWLWRRRKSTPQIKHTTLFNVSKNRCTSALL